jgi:hypothetical protein
MNTAFRPHGKFTIQVDGPLMVTDITGPWNKELVEYWADRCYPQARALSDAGPYVGIAVFHESMLCPPDAMDMLRKIVYYSATKLRCIAHVIVAAPSVDGRDFLESTFARIYDGVVEHRIFYTVEEARAWSLAFLDSRGPDAMSLAQSAP